MRVFVYEWSSCTPDAPPSLRREGEAMLHAVLQDFEAAGVQTATLSNEETNNDRFRELAARSEFTLVIAPETNGVLPDLAEQVRCVGGRLLGSSLEAIKLTSDKQQCGDWWRLHGVPTPQLWNVSDNFPFPIVIKPRNGAGSIDTFLIKDRNGLQERINEKQNASDDFILQSHVAGQPASVAFLLGPRCRISLPPATQNLSQDGRFRYLGGSIPLPNPLAQRATNLARQAIDCVPGLAGYVGVDLVLADAEDGSGDYAIEINPRLTTSYIGLRQLCRDNLALAMLQIAQGEEVKNLRWHAGPVHF